LGGWQRRVNYGLCRDDVERLEQLHLLRDLRQDGGNDAEHEFLYRNLSILDDKASALLGFNSIVLAALAIFYTSARYLVERLIFLVALIVTAISCYLCLRVVWIHWTDNKTFGNSELYWLELMNVRDERTKMYRRAWLLAEVSLAILLMGAVVTAIFS
jgi:hypothetical protein